MDLSRFRGADIDLWDLTDLQPVPGTLPGHRDDIKSLAFHPGGTFLASGADDGRIVLWNWADRTAFGELFVSASGVNSVAFDPSGARLASGSCDAVEGLLCREGRVILWDLDPASWERLACHLAGRNLTLTEWSQYFHNGEYHVTCPQWPASPVP